MKRLPSLQILILIAVITLAACSGETTQVSNKQPPKHKLQTVTKSLQFKKLKLPAFTRSKDRASLAFQVNGTIENRLVRLGDKVEKEDVLMTIYNPQLGPQINNFLAQIASINAQIKQADNEIRRFQNLVKTKVVSQNDLDRLINQKDSLAAQQESLQAQLNNAKALNNESVLTAPFSGFIASIHKDVGEVVMAGAAVLTINGLNALETEINVPIHLQEQLELGQRLTVIYREQIIEGEIQELSQSANPDTQLFGIVIHIPNQLNLRAGERVIVEINEHLGELYQVPLEAIVDDGINQPHVFILNNAIVEKKDIVVSSIVNATANIQIDATGPLQVVTQGQHLLKTGMSLVNNE